MSVYATNLGKFQDRKKKKVRFPTCPTCLLSIYQCRIITRDGSKCQNSPIKLQPRITFLLFYPYTQSKSSSSSSSGFNRTFARTSREHRFEENFAFDPSLSASPVTYIFARHSRAPVIPSQGFSPITRSFHRCRAVPTTYLSLPPPHPPAPPLHIPR